MTIEDFSTLWQCHPAIGAVSQQIQHSSPCRILLSGLYASARSCLLVHVMDALQTGKKAGGGQLLAIMDNEDEAQYLFSDLRTLGATAYYYPLSHRRKQVQDESMMMQRTEVLTYLSKNDTQTPAIIVTYPEALAEPTPSIERLANVSFQMTVGESLQVTMLAERLTELAFTRVDFVYEPGQYAIRGGIVDIYSFANDLPIRLDFFGDEIDSIREFDIETQLSKNKLKQIDIVGRTDSETAPATLLDYLSPNVLLVSNDWGLVHFRYDTLPIEKYNTLELADKSYFGTYEKITFHTQTQPLFHKNFDLLTDDLKRKTTGGYRVYILADQKKQTDRLQSIFENEGTISFTPVDHTLHGGWVDDDLKICCYSDHEIFERYHRVTLKTEEARRGKAIITLKEINQLRPGDYVVHTDHGIGKFGGLITSSVNGKPQEMIKLVYRDGDIIYVSIHNLHRISKYKGREGSEPTLSKIGSSAWERLKERTKDRVKDIARDLIQLYAKRKKQEGFAYTPDGYMQHELEASFLYEDTPDQAKATLDIKHDMESVTPMDRLVCGDVGFGKTEVAMRAAFKAATDGKQVAVLVPTTVLALQHYNTFHERFKDFPVRVEYISRGKSAKEVKTLLAELESGKIDILIGTHKLVSKQVCWHDLGLLIIDEEQKFGVAVKEKLKALRTSVDVLTLTATPIPRTLQFSLLGARDLSVMTTPPPNRYPILTEVIQPDDEDIIREAILLEMNRNGQIFIVNNHIDMLPRIQNRIQTLCPEARIVMAHGQMPPDEMEERLEAFINYDYDILISTTIIESGVDIPNVNTILIFSAQHYGLSDLHQLRGRVGRSNRKAYCYLIAPPKELLTEDARRRLTAITTFAELGSGFNLAMQDLDIRGAGNMLGAEQSGFIADLGYETYQRILNEAVEELKNEMGMGNNETDMETSTLFSSRGFGEGGTMWCNDSQLESDLSICFPNTYIENVSERIVLYRELDSLHTEEEIRDFKIRLIDRFGPLPNEAEELLNVVKLRRLCCQLGVEKIYLKGERVTMYFVQHSDKYWQSDTFGKIINYIASRGDRCRLVEEVNKKGEKTGRRYATINNVKTLGGAINLLTKILNGFMG